MRLAGTSSWSLAAGWRLPGRTTLFVRDVARLSPPGIEVVPPLVGDVPDRRDLLDVDERQRAGAQWLDWWNQILDLELECAFS
jgi:hypothetical protein